MDGLFGHRITAAYARVNENKALLNQKESFLDQIKTQIKQTQALTLKKSYMNKKSNMESGIPAAKHNYTQSLRDLIYQINGFFLYCSGLRTEGLTLCDASLQEQYTQLATFCIRELILYEKKAYAIEALQTSNQEFKGLYDVEEMEEKTPANYAKALVKDIEDTMKAEKNAIQAAEAAALKAAKEAKEVHERELKKLEAENESMTLGTGNGSGTNTNVAASKVVATTIKAKTTSRAKGKGKAKEEEEKPITVATTTGNGTGNGAGNGSGSGSNSGSGNMNRNLGGGKRKTRKLRR